MQIERAKLTLSNIFIETPDGRRELTHQEVVELIQRQQSHIEHLTKLLAT